MSNNELDLLQAARCEDLVYEQIPELTVLGKYERKVVDTLKQMGAHLLQGSRGVGKSMLMRQAEVELDDDFSEERKLAVYVSFKTSTLLEGVKADERNAFQVWVGVKILQALYEKLLMLDVIGNEKVDDPYSRVFGFKSGKKTSDILREKIHKLQKLATVKNNGREELISEIGKEFLDKVNDITFINELIKDIMKEYNINKINFLFDEAAHTFIPEQQEIFFEIFKLLHGGEIAVKAAVYPTVTSYGRNFEIGQDAIVIKMDRFETGLAGRKTNRELYRSILLKRLPQKGKLRKDILSKGKILDQCIDLSTGNPRSFLHLLNSTIDKGYSDRALLLATQEFVDTSLLPYHNNLTKRLPKYSHHVRTGIDLLKDYIIPQIREKNHRKKKKQYQSAYFTIQRDMSPNLKLALDILCYSGVLSNQGTVKIADRKTGLRYMVHLAILFTQRAFLFSDLHEAIKSLSLTDYREFNKNDPNIESYLLALKEASDKCPNCSTEVPANAKFCSECGMKIDVKSIVGSLLDEPVSELEIGKRLAARVKTHYPCVGDVIQATREELKGIKYIKEVRSRIIKNAAEEFISG